MKKESQGGGNGSRAISQSRDIHPPGPIVRPGRDDAPDEKTEIERAKPDCGSREPV